MSTCLNPGVGERRTEEIAAAIRPLSGADRPTALLTKRELARELRVSIRTVDQMMADRTIPFIKTSMRAVRFYLPRVLAALQRREVREATE